MDIRPVTGNELLDVLPDLAKLRINVFREWPYLYDGTLEYEQKYLTKFKQDPHAVIAVARDGKDIVGASTASPLYGHADEFAQPFKDRGYDPARVFYFGESVLLPEYRGRGIGHAFFDIRERHAKSVGNYNIAAFCAVMRDERDLRKPSDYRPLNSFWTKRGFAMEHGLLAEFSWKEPDTAEEISHRLQFWVKTL